MVPPARRSDERSVRHRARRHARHQRRRRRRRGWTLLIFSLLLCLFVATYALWDSERPAKTTAIASVDRPTSVKPPRPPAPERTHAVEELRSKLQGISESHAGTYGVVVFDPYSGATASLNADRRFVAASLSKLYALLTLYRAASLGELSLDDKITMHSSDVWAYGSGVLSKYPNKYPVGYTMTPNDILLVLKKIADPSYTSPQLSAEMLELMTNTSFEERLPKPLPEGTRVAHKIGSYESTLSDAGIVFPEESGKGQEYYIVVFCEGAAQVEAIETIQDISLATYQTLAR